ncbi:MAG TPA: hypothetical protein PLU72_02455 [Candidatus Ozemobacteraceae bacterium]|nr:hypothetical protein [Candidatus Ozemobacteraceae bacterium]
MRPVSLILAVGVVFSIAAAAPAQEPAAGTQPPIIDTSKTPWLEGVTIPTKPPHVSPLVPVDIAGEGGNPVPATISEDIPILLMANSEIFGEKPPATWNGTDLPDAEWTGRASVRWFFEDVAKNRSMLASLTDELPENQVKVIPLDPTKSGAVTITIARPMKYRIAADRFRTTFVNASRSLSTIVTDITPPVCGLEITAGGESGTVYPVENPVHAYPLPKHADVICRGKLFGTAGDDESVTVEGLELGARMIVPAERATLRLAKEAVVTLKPLLQDNQQVDEKTVRFGLCEGTGEKPALVGQENPAELKLAEVKLPEKPFLFIEAADLAGNRQVLYIPIQIQ